MIGPWLNQGCSVKCSDSVFGSTLTLAPEAYTWFLDRNALDWDFAWSRSLVIAFSKSFDVASIYHARKTPSLLWDLCLNARGHLAAASSVPCCYWVNCRNLWSNFQLPHIKPSCWGAHAVGFVALSFSLSPCEGDDYREAGTDWSRVLLSFQESCVCSRLLLGLSLFWQKIITNKKSWPPSHGVRRTSGSCMVDVGQRSSVTHGSCKHPEWRHCAASTGLHSERPLAIQREP